MTNTETQNPSPETAVSPVRILVADDHEVMRLGIRNLLEARPKWAVCGEASNGQEAVEKTLQLHPDIIILDITMPTMNGLEAASRITAALPEIPIVLFSLHVSDDLMRSIRSHGIRGIVSKGDAARDLVSAVEAVLQGGTFYSGGRSLAQMDS